MLLGTYEERLKAVKETCRILKPEGNFIFTTPYLDNKTLKSYWLEKAFSLDIDVQSMTWDQIIFLFITNSFLPVKNGASNIASSISFSTIERNPRAPVFCRTIDTHIKNLRNALGDYRDFIVTLRGVGYKFEYDS